MLFMTTLMMGTLITISASSWISMWMGLEINLLSFIPLISKSHNPKASEASLKYFIVQSISSMIILFIVTMTLSFNEYFDSFSIPMMTIFNSALLTKMGAAPFHFWFPEILEGLNWLNSTILLTWQKIAPLMILTYNFTLNYFFICIILISLMISGISGWNQISMKKILAFSSINHMGWMIAILYFNQSLMFFYFSFYVFSTLSLTLVLNKFNINSFNQFMMIFNMKKSLKLFFFFNLFSLGGLPPFLGFFPKWLVLSSLLENNHTMLAFSMVILTLMTLFIYTRMILNTLNLKTIQNKMMISNTNKKLFFILNFINLSGLMLFTLAFNFN